MMHHEESLCNGNLLKLLVSKIHVCKELVYNFVPFACSKFETKNFISPHGAGCYWNDPRALLTQFMACCLPSLSWHLQSKISKNK